jgi:hypothetical protein
MFGLVILKATMVTHIMMMTILATMIGTVMVKQLEKRNLVMTT